MKRREFIQIAAITGATAALAGCGHPERQLIRFVPEEDLEPGMAEWKPSICPACSAGCGVLARVMEGEAEVVRNNQLGLINMGLVKKLEGNPPHPISRGKLCPRGQAAIQITYHPDRLTDPLRRTGPRGSGQFQKITWEEGLQELTAKIQELIRAKDASRLAFLTRPLGGQAGRLVELFLASLGAPPAVAFEVFDEAVSRRANELSFGHAQLPTFDLGNTNYLISFGADFLGTWNSPVAHARAYGEMRQGRSGVRGKFVQVEPRMSQTGANADEWIPAGPGTEGILALGLAHVILSEELRPTGAASDAGNLVEGWSRGLPEYTPEEVQKKTGVAAATVERLAREMVRHSPALAIIGGAPLAHTNGLFNALAVNALNILLGSVLKPGGIFFTPELPTGAMASKQKATSVRALAERITSGEAGPIKALLLYDANPVFGTPPGWRVRDALEKTPFLVSFGSFLDETSILADLILPDHSFLESWVEHVPESGTTQAVESLAPPAMRPLHNTRSMPDVLLAVAHQLGGRVAAALEWETFDAMLRESFAVLSKPGAGGSKEPQMGWEKAQKQGGWWSAPANPPKFALRTTRVRAPRSREPEWDGSPQQFPFHFLPYASQSFLDGSLAHLPWLQELPDVLATAMWGAWVEINPQTAERLGIQQGDVVEVASQHGKLQAPALLSPGIAPDVLAMPVGQGHRNFTRYARGRGANPLEILAPLVEPETGALAWAATRVRISRVGQGKLVLFGGGLRESPTERWHR
jgi:menaquinone reductase, molybdopterin-binding-like subunit